MSNEFHPEYIEASPKWKKVRLSQRGQDAVRDECELFLPKTSGMKKNKNGDEIYNSYKNRARFYSLTDGYTDTVIGLATEKDFILENTHGTENITKNGLGIDMFFQQCLENVCLIGRHVLVNDAVDNKPYIAQYTAESLVDWATDDFGEFIWAKFQETYDAEVDPRKRDMQIRYREYYLDDNQWTVYTTDKGGSITSEITKLALPVDEDKKQLCPITILGSRTNKAEVDHIPALPIVEASLAAYMISADLRQTLFGLAQPTLYATGVNDDEVESIIDRGVGVGGILWSSNPEAKFGMVETKGNGVEGMDRELNKELEIGKEQALRIVNQGEGVESAKAISIRTSGQRATVWTMFNSVSAGIQRSLMILDKWQGYSKDVVFEIKADFTQAQAEHTMLKALNDTVNSSNIPQSVLFQWLRDSKMTEKTDEELLDDIATQSPAGMQLGL